MPRCLLGCPDGIRQHRFPHPVKNPLAFKAWVQIAGGTLDSEADYKYYSKKTLCTDHFIDAVKNRWNRLNFVAIPVLRLNKEMAEISSSIASMPHFQINLQEESNLGTVTVEVKCEPDVALLASTTKQLSSGIKRRKRITHLGRVTRSAMRSRRYRQRQRNLWEEWENERVAELAGHLKTVQDYDEKSFLIPVDPTFDPIVPKVEVTVPSIDLPTIDKVDTTKAGYAPYFVPVEVKDFDVGIKKLIKVEVS